MRIAFIIIGALLLLGCETTGTTRKFQERDQSAEEADRLVAQYCRSLARDPRLAPLDGRTAVFDTDITPQHMAIDKTATPAERRALLALTEISRACDTRQRAWLREYYPRLVRAFEDYVYRSETILLAAYEGEVTFGQFNQLRRESYYTYYQQSQQLWRQIARERARAIAEARERQRRAAQVMSQIFFGISRAYEAQAEAMREYQRQRSTVRCRWEMQEWVCRKSPY